MAHLYPIFLHLIGRVCLVVGGGKVAERKIATLMEYEAQIRVVTPDCTQQITSWAEQDKIELRRGIFEPGDLERVSLVFAATGDVEVNRVIAELSRKQGIWVNAVDDPQNCDFFVPSILRRQSLCVAISTEGKSPLLAARLRRELEQHLPPVYGDWVEILGELREQIKNSPLDIEERRRVFESLVDSDILDLLQAGRLEQAEERIKRCMSCLQA